MWSFNQWHGREWVNRGVRCRCLHLVAGQTAPGPVLDPFGCGQYILNRDLCGFAADEVENRDSGIDGG